MNSAVYHPYKPSSEPLGWCYCCHTKLFPRQDLVARRGGIPFHKKCIGLLGQLEDQNKQSTEFSWKNYAISNLPHVSTMLIGAGVGMGVTSLLELEVVKNNPLGFGIIVYFAAGVKTVQETVKKIGVREQTAICGGILSAGIVMAVRMSL